jgi:hypothetical protein
LTLPEAIGGAEAVVILTRWPEFKELPRLFASLPEQPVLIDGRRMLEKSSFRRYEGVGLRSPENQVVPAPGKHPVKKTFAHIFAYWHASGVWEYLNTTTEFALGF